MIKNIYDKKNNRYYHEYFCDCCVACFKKYYDLEAMED